jgi:hypothetical protein
MEAGVSHAIGSVKLFGRTRIGVRFHVAPLFVNHPAQFPLHYLEGVVDYLRQRLVRAVINLFFFRDQFVSGRDGDINPHSELVSFFVSMIRLLDRDVAAADVIAKFVQPGRFLQHQLFDSLGFFQAAVRDVYWQLHNVSIVTLPGGKRQAFSYDWIPAHFLDCLQGAKMGS